MHNADNPRLYSLTSFTRHIISFLHVSYGNKPQVQLCIFLDRSPEGITPSATSDSSFGPKKPERSTPQFSTVGLGYILKERMIRTGSGNIFGSSGQGPPPTKKPSNSRNILGSLDSSAEREFIEYIRLKTVSEGRN